MLNNSFTGLRKEGNTGFLQYKNSRTLLQQNILNTKLGQNQTMREFGKDLSNISNNSTLNEANDQKVMRHKLKISKNKCNVQFRPVKNVKEILKKQLLSKEEERLNRMDQNFNKNDENFNSINIPIKNKNVLSQPIMKVEINLLPQKQISLPQLQETKMHLDYFEEIHQHLNFLENESSLNLNYMSDVQNDINEKMRLILIDWLVDVHFKYKLREETLFLGVWILDTFLSKIEINRRVLQLIGITSLFIASKYEEIYPPNVKEFAYVTDNACQVSDILKCENEIHSILKFNFLQTPSMLRFLEIFIHKLEISNNKCIFYSKFLMETCLLDYSMLKFKNSLIAFSVLNLSLNKFNLNTSEIIIKLCGLIGSKFNPNEIKECSTQIQSLVEKIKGQENIQAIQLKYSKNRYLKVAEC
jgi:hypothetical protein